MFDHIQKLGMEFHTSARTGDLISRAVSDTAQLQMMLGALGFGLISTLLTLPIGIVAIFLLSWKLAIISLIVFPLFVFSANFFSLRIRRLSRRLQESNAERTQVLSQAIHGVRDIKMLGIENEFLRRFREKVIHLAHSTVELIKSISTYKEITGFMGGISTLLLLWFGGREFLDHNISVGTLSAFATILIYVFSAALRVVRLSGDAQVARASWERISEILSLPPERKKSSRVQSFSIKGEVHFKEVAFQYNNNRRPVLHDLNFKIKPEECVAIVGPSGIGKTTLVNLLLGFYTPQYGQVLIDGIDVRDIEPEVLRREVIGVFPQEPFIFPDSIKQNILLGREDASEEEIITAAKAANIHDFIASLPEGYNTKISEKGLNLSGGERQKIAIARALLRNPKILIFGDSEKLIIEALREIVRGRTTIIITHRLSLLALASRVAILNNGKIEIEGNYHEVTSSFPTDVESLLT
jgi:subfamily B ATP-binding cassette protein MsbA